MQRPIVSIDFMIYSLEFHNCPKVSPLLLRQLFPQDYKVNSKQLTTANIRLFKIARRRTRSRRMLNWTGVRLVVFVLNAQNVNCRFAWCFRFHFTFGFCAMKSYCCVLNRSGPIKGWSIAGMMKFFDSRAMKL